MQIIRIRDLQTEYDLNNIWIPVDKDTYASNAKKININDLIVIVSSGLTLQYINANPVPETIGGIEAGSTFPSPGNTMQEMWDLLLYPYQYPAFKYYYFQDHNGTTLEIGNSFTGDTALWQTSNPTNVSANTVSIYGYNLTTLTGLADSGSHILSFNSVVTRSSGDGKGIRTWNISAKNTKNQTFTTSFSLRWDWMFYWGTSPLTGLTNIEITGLTNNYLYSAFSRTYSYGTYDYKYLCFADEYGGPTNFVDGLTGFQVAMYDGYPNVQNGYSYDLVSVTNEYSQTTNYRVYRTKNTLGGAINIIVI